MKKGILTIVFMLAFLYQTIEGGFAMDLKSAAFNGGGMMPAKYTCDGMDVSPPLTWDNAPVGTKSFALICDDPDAPVGTWVHWVCYDIPAGTKSLPENVAKTETLTTGGRQGVNDFRKAGYGGPCPPGGVHRYFFKLYALDTLLNLTSGTTKQELLKAMEGHILGEAQLMGKYKR